MKVEEQRVPHHAHPPTPLSLSLYSQPHLLDDKKIITIKTQKARAYI